jgi:hypothetical protein
MSKNARKFQKTQGGKHNARCLQTPDKARYRDMKEAKLDLRYFRGRATSDLQNQGFTTFNQKRVYECAGCKGFHLTSQELGRVQFEVVSNQELAISSLMLSA